MMARMKAFRIVFGSLVSLQGIAIFLTVAAMYYGGTGPEGSSLAQPYSVLWYVMLILGILASLAYASLLVLKKVRLDRWILVWMGLMILPYVLLVLIFPHLHVAGD